MNLRYLLLTGKRRSGHLRTTVSVYTAAPEAHAEFGRRQRRLPTGGWIELLSIDDLGRITQLRRTGDQPERAPQAATSRSAEVGSAPMWTCT